MQANQKANQTIKKVNGEKYKEMLLGALMWLKEQQTLVDSLNVFPVPDGDTGTNMYLTFLDAVKAAKKVETDKVWKINEALAKGALMGARGNSGVILSQLIRGFHLANKNNEDFDTKNLADSLKKASEVAYKGVMKPVEGTILTVSRKAAEGAEMAVEENLDLVGVMENTIAYAREALNKTPEQLKALKDAGVVDAGGQGYLVILEGMMKGLIGDKAFKQSDLELVKPVQTQKIQEDIKFVYCTEILIDMEKEDKKINEIRSELETYGDSLLVVGTADVVKVHIHTNHPGIVLEYGLKLGSITDIKIDNMKLQSAEKVRQEEEKTRQEFLETQGKGIIAVGQGDGLKKILSDLGVNIIIEGGQSMNPSTNDFVEAIKNINSSEVLLLPNNKNVISSAKQAASLSDKNVEVIPTRSIPQAIASLMVYNPEAELGDLKEAMTDELEHVKTLEVTKAVKDSKVNDIDIEKGDVIGLFNHDIKNTGKSYNEVVLALISDVLEDEELVTIYYGEDVTQKEAELLKEVLVKNFEFDEVEIYNGKQPLYPFLISLE
ncbi:DAK2 domain-containing protein [Natronospora cellulosivora (SeqCode)]